MKDNTTYNPLITIAIPTYNRADTYLPSVIECALNQTYPHIDIVVSDNCSKDETASLVRSYNSEKIRYIRHDPALTPNDNFNYCLSEARGKYFLLLHDDDLIDNDFVETCVYELNRQGEDTGIVRTGTRLIDNENNTIQEVPNDVVGLSTEEFFIGWFEGKTGMYVCSSLFNTELLKAIGGFQSKRYLFQDVIAEFTLAAKYGRIDIRDIKASFRKHGDSMGDVGKAIDWCEDSQLLLETMCELTPNNKKIIRKKGSANLSKKCYKHAYVVDSKYKRIGLYWYIYRKFNFKYSPIHFLYLDRIKKRLKKTIAAKVFN